MRAPFVYLAQPIDFVQPQTSDFWVDTLVDVGLAVYTPRDAFTLPAGSTPTSVIGDLNRAALSRCDALLAVLPPAGSTSIGVPMEIGQAYSEGKPVMIVGDRETAQRSWALCTDSPNVVYVNELTTANARKLFGMIVAEKARSERRSEGRALFVKAEENAILPTRAYQGDAGFDLYTYGDWVIQGGENLDVPCGISVQLPHDVWAMITGRSSTVRKHRLLVTTGIIDSGYRGPLYANVENLGELPVEIKSGQRVAQLIPFPLTASTLRPVRVDVLSPSDRGESGFGSSGA